MRNRSISVSLLLAILIVVMHNGIPHDHHDGRVTIHHHDHGSGSHDDEKYPGDDPSTTPCQIRDLTFETPRGPEPVNQRYFHGSSWQMISSIEDSEMSVPKGAGYTCYHPPGNFQLSKSVISFSPHRGPPCL